MKEILRIEPGLDNPTNVVVGRLDGRACFCVQGTMSHGDRDAAAVQMHDAGGDLVWRSERSHPEVGYRPGAYVQWIEGPDLPEPLVLYSFVPQSDERRGGARLLRARDGRILGEIENTTRFGNNNSLVADIDGDGKTELVYAEKNTLTCYELPSLEPRWSYGEGVVFCWGLPALMDVDPNGRCGIAFGSEYDNPDGTSSMIAIDAQGRKLWRSDGHAEDLGSTPVFVLDVDGDGEDELLKVGLDLEHRRRQPWNHLHVFDSKGRLKTKIELGFTGIAIGDLDDDGHLEGVGLCNPRDGGSNRRSEVRCIDLATGQPQWTCPVDRAYLDTNSPLTADVNGDGRPEAVVGTGNPAGYGRLPGSRPWGDLYVLDAGGKIDQHLELPGWPVNLAFCDVNDDGLEELIVVLDGIPGRIAVYATAARALRLDWPTPFGSPHRDGCRGLR